MINNSDPIIRDLEIMSNSVNYRQWIFDNVKDAMGRRIIELGAGIGNFTSMFSEKELVVAIDNYAPAVEVMRKKFLSFPNIVPLQMDIEGPELISLRKYEADTVVCINVLEHLLDDSEALSKMNAILPSGGKFILLVPAFEFLLGTIDHVVGHQRRYSKKELSSKLREASFRINDLYFMNIIAVFGWYLNNRILKRQEESLSQVLIFDKYITPWLKLIEQAVRPPFGLSLVGICEKE